ncbi:MAG: hypothetical protein ACI924_001459, partial [Flavobacterium sp.]
EALTITVVVALVVVEEVVITTETTIEVEVVFNISFKNKEKSRFISGFFLLKNVFDRLRLTSRI